MQKPRARRRGPASRTKLLTADPAAQLARVTALAEQIFGDRAKARRWLCKAKLELGGASPLAYLANEAGARTVEEMLYRIDSGILS